MDTILTYNVGLSFVLCICLKTFWPNSFKKAFKTIIQPGHPFKKHNHVHLVCCKREAEILLTEEHNPKVIYKIWCLQYIFFSQSKSLLGTFLQRESEPDKETRWVNKGGTLMDLAGPFLPKPPLKPLFDYWHSGPVGGHSEWLQRSDDDATLYICYVCLSLAVLNELSRTCVAE